MRFPVFDLHCDTALGLLGKDMEQAGNLRSNSLHIDLERASRLPGYCQCFACFTTPYMEKWAKTSPVVVFERELVSIQRELDRNKDLMKLAYSPKQIRENLAAGKMSAVLTIEGPAGFGYDPALLEDLYKIGFRITSLGWNESNPLTGSHVTGGGLTDQGREFVREAQRLGMLVDVSHISDEGFWDIMDITQAPVVATHSNSRKICDVSRNLTDDMFLAICKTGGVRIWIRPAIISCISWSWIPAASISPLAAIWTAVISSQWVLKASRVIPIWQIVWSPGVLGKILLWISSGITPSE